MLFDKENLFSEAQAVTATAVSDNVIDLGATGTVLNAPAALIRDIGPGEPIAIRIQLLAAAGGTNPTLVVTLEVDDNSGFSSAKVVGTSAEIADGAAGAVASIVWVPNGTDERYLRLNYTTAGTNPTHSITAGIVGANQTSNPVPGA